MHEQRRHQRIRFGIQPPIKIGFAGESKTGTLENLSLSGLMVRTVLPLEVGKTFGCEFSVFGSTRIDVAAVTVSRIGDLFGARFQSGPISELLIKDAIDGALASGRASVVNMHQVEGRKVLRVAGGLNATLANDFDYSLNKIGIDELDLSGVTKVDLDGIGLCRLAVQAFGVTIGTLSDCFAEAWNSRGDAAEPITPIAQLLTRPAS